MKLHGNEKHNWRERLMGSGTQASNAYALLEFLGKTETHIAQLWTRLSLDRAGGGFTDVHYAVLCTLPLMEHFFFLFFSFMTSQGLIMNKWQDEAQISVLFTTPHLC